MWVKVRSVDGKTERIDGLSKLTKIEVFRDDLIKKFDAVDASHLRLFYGGKQLENGYTLFDYNVGLNDIVQVLITPDSSENPSSLKKTETQQNESVKENVPTASGTATCIETPAKSKYFLVEDLIDAKDEEYGAWFEAKIVNIISSNVAGGQVMNDISNSQKKKDDKDMELESPDEESVLYEVLYDRYEDDGPQRLPLNRIRPRARRILKFDNIHVGDRIMVNYNVDEPKELGYWYDCEITGLKLSNARKYIIGTIIMGSDNVPLEKCKITFLEELFAIESYVPVEEKRNQIITSDVVRTTKANCKHCRDIQSRKCRYCSCNVCGEKTEPAKQILCDECNLAFHIWCLNPPLMEVPSEDDWYCPSCKNDENEVVKAGEKLKKSKKKANMASASSSSSRDWGKGMACVGRTKICTIVRPNHFGPIPGIEVGMSWMFRVQVSECGVHRMQVAGIHGRENEGAFSIVLAGGYEDDMDGGNEFTYTGSGGRNLSGNKRTAEQSCDQKLTKMNKALAKGCAAKFDDKNGATAVDWIKGKPVRVVRNFKGHKHSKYCPEEGNRYDGIYKCVKYWPAKGLSGFLVWKYLFRRDDPTPAPWTEAGKKRIKMLGLKMEYPDGYLESLEGKKLEAGASGIKNKGSKKRACSDSDDDSHEEESPAKRAKTMLWKLSDDVQSLISDDVSNKKGWDACLKFTVDGQTKFLKEVETNFLCICCQEVVYQPVTTKCSHNICKACLRRSFKAEVYSCPACRYELGKNYTINVNQTLQDILTKLFPGYEAGRMAN